MAKCKLCKTNIPEDTEYCEDCQDKGDTKANESYLDGLLNSVNKSTPTAENVYKKRSSTNENISSPDTIINKPQKSEITQKDEQEDDDVYRVDFSDIEDFDQFNYEDDLKDTDRNIIISDEELFGENLSHIFSKDNENEEDNDFQEEIAKVVHGSIDEERQESKEEIVPVENSEIVGESLLEMQTEGFTKLIEIDQEETVSDTPFNTDSFDFAEEFPGIPDSSIQNTDQDEVFDIPEDNNIDLDLDEMLNNLDTPKVESSAPFENLEEDMFHTFGEEEEELDEMQMLTGGYADKNIAEEEIEDVEAGDDDFLSLLNQMSDEDPSSEDVRAINDLLNNVPVKNSKNMPSDVGEVFSDALKAVSSLKDYELDEEGILSEIPDDKNKKGKKEKKASKKEKTKKPKREKEKKEKSEFSLFQRLFGNIKDEKTAAIHSEQVSKSADVKAAIPKKKKGKKGSEPQPEDDEGLMDKGSVKGKEVSKKNSKKDKAEKKKRTKEIIQVIDEIDEDPGRINRLGAFIVFVFFGILVLIVVLGSKVVSYSLSIEHATTYFNNRKYTQAYNEVYGVDIKDEDIVIYDKIKTVMFVNKQLNSYNNYYAIGQYPEALDSLLKGLSRYDKYIELATMLGIETDLDYVRNQILAELYNVFNLTEKEAIQILEYESMKDYSLSVYDVVIEKMNN